MSGIILPSVPIFPDDAQSPQQSATAPLSENGITALLETLLDTYDALGRSYKAQQMTHQQYESDRRAIIVTTARCIREVR